MQVRMATSAGHPGRVNEDFVGAVPGAVVLLDGAGIVGIEEICRHGVAWFTHRLGGVLLGKLSVDDGRALAVLLGEAIEQVADAHRGTCDLADPSSPHATVVILRRHDHLVLGDSFLLLDRVVVADGREVAFRRVHGAAYDAAAEGTPERERARAEFITALRANRNQPGGYWVAKEDPHAAAEAVIGTHRLDTGAMLLSNGVSRLVDPLGVTDWAGLAGRDPAELIAWVRAEEARRPEVTADDATVARCTP